jgi:hypothetical protein
MAVVFTNVQRLARAEIDTRKYPDPGEEVQSSGTCQIYQYRDRPSYCSLYHCHVLSHDSYNLERSQL